jgi:hypothetical protein
MSENNQLDYETEQDMMILSLESDFDVLGIDENCHETSMLLTSFDEEGKQENKHNSSYSTVLTECSSTIHMGDDEGFLDADRIGEILPAKVSSHVTVKEEPEQSTPIVDRDGRDSDQTDKDTPEKFDVLCGQSRVCANHTGNKRFQTVLDLYAPKYDAVSTKQEKMTLTKEIVSRIRDAGGRFLKYKEGRWQEISTVTARDKVSHALRTKVASWKRQQEQDKTEGDGAASTTPTKGKPGHRRKRSGNSPRHRQSSCSSINTCSSDIVTSSFDGSDPSSNTLIEDLLKTQREIFANLQKDSGSTADHPLKRSSR